MKTLSSLFVIIFAIWSKACSDDKGFSLGCEQKKTGIELQNASWTARGAEDGILSNAEFRAAAKASLSALKSPLAKPGKISVEGSLTREGEELAMVLKARIDLEELPVPIEAGVAATSVVTEAEGVKKLVGEGLGDLAHALTNLLSLVGADNGRLVLALRSAEPDEQILALKLLGMRKASEAIEAIGENLTDPRVQVAETAAETLAIIGDERAVPLLIKSIERHDLRSEVRAIEAMGAIGGTEAEAYLEMTANGHEVAEVRNLSKRLLEKLREKE